MTWDEMAVVGRIARTHGIRGHVFVNPDTDFPEARFAVGAELNVGRGDGTWERMSVIDARFQSGRPVIALSGVADMSAAEALNGAELRVPVETLVELPPGTFYHHDLIGCRVETTDGTFVGDVSSIEGSGVDSRLVIPGEAGEVLIPLVEAMCPTIDPANRRIVIAPPPGLLELNAKGAQRR